VKGHDLSDATRLLTISQAAARLGVSVQTLRAYADKGIVPVVKLPSGYRRFDAETIDRTRREWEVKRYGESR
jgi:excisionase family DNA binding protein